MSYSAREGASGRARSPALSSAGRRQPVQSSQPRRPRDGDSAYVEDSRSVGEAVKKIQQLAADIRKESSVLGTAHSYTGSKKKVTDAARAAKATMEEAKRLLEGLPTGGGGSMSEQNHRRLTQQKLTENLMGASKAVEAALRAYDAAEAERARRDAAGAAAAAAAPGHGRRGSTGVELHAMDGVDVEDGRLGGQQRIQEVAELTEAETEVHTAIVDEYVQEIANMASGISSLQRAMVDLAEHAQAQGVTLDNIEANMANAVSSTTGATEQLTQASRHHRVGTKLLFWLLIIAVVIAVTLIFIVVRRH